MHRRYEFRITFRPTIFGPVDAVFTRNRKVEHFLSYPADSWSVRCCNNPRGSRAFRRIA